MKRESGKKSLRSKSRRGRRNPQWIHPGRSTGPPPVPPTPRPDPERTMPTEDADRLQEILEELASTQDDDGQDVVRPGGGYPFVWSILDALRDWRNPDRSLTKRTSRWTSSIREIEEGTHDGRTRIRAILDLIPDYPPGHRFYEDAEKARAKVIEATDLLRAVVGWQSYSEAKAWTLYD